MDNSTKTIIAIAVVLIVIIGGYYMWKSPSQPAETGPIKIGLSSPMTGELASYGDDFWQLAEAAGAVEILIGAESGDQEMLDYIDKKIKVWGQTQTAQYAGWLMDVGRVEVLE